MRGGQFIHWIKYQFGDDDLLPDWKPLVAPGGFVALHDSVAPKGTPGLPALVRRIRETEMGFQFVSEVDSLTIFRRCLTGVEVEL